MAANVPHLLIEEGPERGREITIPPNGARIGRADENDIQIADAAMSRFQCRMYFREGFLHLMDLGSTNESLVNNKPVSDAALRFGDEILIGESLIKVINDGLHENRPRPAAGPVPAAEPEPAPIIFNLEDPPAPEKAEDSEAPHSPVLDVDLGLGRREDLEENAEKSPRNHSLGLLLVTLVTMLVVFGIGLLFLSRTGSQKTPPPAPDNRLQIHYEKVIAGDGNIFRYALDLSSEGEIIAEVHDLRQQRSISREETIDPEQIQGLRSQLVGSKDSLLALQG
ncbi:MAG: FHA domain-containing protein, partial [Kiritimatiellia bacterium]